MATDHSIGYYIWQPIKWLLYFIGGILALLLLIILLIQIPSIQTWITGKVTSSFEEQWGTEVSIGRVNINFFETASLEDVYLEDQQGDTLLYAGYLKADIGAFALAGQSIVLDEILLENTYINLHRAKDSANFNYQFIIDSFVQPDTVPDTTSGGFDFDLHEVNLRNIHLRMKDDSAKTDLLVKLPSLSTDIATLGLESSHLQVDQILIEGLSGYFASAPVASVPENDSLQQSAAPLDSAWLNPSGMRYSVEEFLVENSSFHYLADSSSQTEGINFANLDINQLQLAINDFYLGSDSLQLQIDQLAVQDANSGFSINEAQASFAIEGSMVSAQIDAFRTPNTKITESIRMAGLDIDPQQPADAMLQKLEASADLNDAVLGMRDLVYFMPDLDTMQHLSQLQPRLSLHMATEDDVLLIEELSLNAEDRLTLRAHGQLENLSQPENLRFNLVIESLQTTAAYLQTFDLLQGSLPPELQKTGQLTLTAQLEGSMENAELLARLKSGPGSISTRINYTAPTENNFLLTGSLSSANFNLQPFVGDSAGLETITLSSKFQVRGLGEKINVPKFSLLIDSVSFNEYTYKALALEGFLIDSVLETAVAYDDPFLALNIGLKSDLKDTVPSLALDGEIARANLLRLNLMEDSLALSTQFAAQLKGGSPDDIVGEFEMLNTEVVRGRQAYTMDSLVLAAGFEADGKREITLLTDFIRMDLTGNYLFEELPMAFDQCMNYYCAAYEVKNESPIIDQSLTLDVHLIDEPVIAKAFVPELNLMHPMDLVVEFRSAERSFDLQLSAPEIAYDTFLIENLKANASTVDRVLSFDIGSGILKAGETIDIPSMALEGKWKQDSLNFAFRLAEQADSSHLMLAGDMRFYPDTVGLELSNTDIRVKGHEFTLSKQATIRYAPDYLYIHNFNLQSDNNQQLRLATQQENTAEPVLAAELEGFQLGDFLDIFGMEEYKVRASLSGQFRIIKPMDLQAMEADLKLADISLDSIAVGNLLIDLDKPNNSNQLQTDIQLNGPKNDLALNGYYNLEDSAQAISLDLNVNSLNLAPWDAFTEGFIRKMNGLLVGDLAIRGTPAQLTATGRLQLTDNASLTLDMTGARYLIGEQPIIFEKERIVFNEFTLRDTLRQPLILDGNITHQYFADFVADLRLTAENFQLVDKDYTLEEPFYGLLGVNANTTIKGPFENIMVEGTLGVTDNTEFTLVLPDEEASAGTKDYINFVNTNAFANFDTTGTAQADSVQKMVDVTGFSMNTRIQVPSSALFRIVVDPNTGDYLEVRGEAEDLRVRMDPLTGIDLQGDFEVSDGRYRLSFMEVVQKIFKVQEGSTVSFNGDPLNAQLDLTAVYTAEVSRYPLIAQMGVSAAEAAAAKRKEPVDVLLTMTGSLEEPTFSFNIIIPEAQYSTSSAVQQQLNLIKSDETRLFKQVFGLIALNRFIPEEPSLGEEGGGAESAINAQINQSLSGFLTEQLGALTQDYLGVELEVELEDQQGSTDPNAKDLNLSLARSFFDESVEVKVGGTTGIGGSTSSPGGEGGNFAGNFEILYHVTPEGNLNLKIFQRTERNFLTNELYPRSGVAVSYSKAFNELDGLFGNEDARNREMLKSDGPVPSEY